MESECAYQNNTIIVGLGVSPRAWPLASVENQESVKDTFHKVRAQLHKLWESGDDLVLREIR